MEYLELARNVLHMEAKSLEEAADKIAQEQVEKLVIQFTQLIRSGGSLVFCGVGKSGIICSKLASTFCSLGLPSWFLHPVEALHGDLGRLNSSDVVCLISKSGSTEEILKLIPFLNIPEQQMIGLLGNPNSDIARKCGIVFDCSVEKEACINNQAPTTSSTLALGMGDAMAVIYERMVGLSKEGFAENHPGGILGKSLKMKVRDLMWDAEDCPVLSSTATLKEVILAMTNRPVGGCAIVDNKKNLLGIMVEGDIRRTFTHEGHGLETSVNEIMTKNPVSVMEDDLAFTALKKMEERQREISILPVVDSGNHFKGFIRLHDLLKEGFSLKK
jgi:arabinose-5-phosphate isomerase